MTGDQHSDHISSGQGVSRHSLPTFLYFLFSPLHIFFNSILASRTLHTFGFACQRMIQPEGKTKRVQSPPLLSRDELLNFN